ncbi:hypothetical protein MJO29_014531 [Puccinia striiformis f. sp. tritici]|uniref:hypothetical protein n=1 Tax=Puccinia striiformis f. sp. tritici TaxID=168172 RepID=UPI00200832F6|nr:hypothetical protein Pst134EA_027104 [Puccinia striiformis f. sp. tritici]KAH9450401.1 hypothetical protein Pst134EA_027104 [Puccinia striiformis f. sp. tritici]KAI7939795.1 hypothetical protein MJO29_014531 [Puccinia striiformis f. sp. tritici]KAI9624010.1 hypothetical protein H4Q26_017021 [Puccinia striiformis f. sp. tritici PST-130]
MKVIFSVPWLVLLQISSAISSMLPANLSRAREQALAWKPTLSVEWQEDEIRRYLSRPSSFPETNFPLKYFNPTFHAPSNPQKLLKSQSSTDGLPPSSVHPSSGLLRFDGVLRPTSVYHSDRELTTGDATCRSDITLAGCSSSSDGLQHEDGLTPNGNDLAYKRKGHVLTSPNDHSRLLVRKRVKVTQDDQKSQDQAFGSLIPKLSDFNPSELQEINKGTAGTTGSAAQADESYDQRQGSRKLTGGTPNGSSEDIAREFSKDEKTRLNQDSLHANLLEGLPKSLDTRNFLLETDTWPSKYSSSDVTKTLLDLSDVKIENEKYHLFDQIMDSWRKQLRAWISSQERRAIASRTSKRIISFVENTTKISTFLILSHAKALEVYKGEIITKEAVEEVLRFMENFWTKMNNKEQLSTSRSYKWLPDVPSLINPNDNRDHKTTTKGECLWYAVCVEILEYWVEQHVDLIKSSSNANAKSDPFEITKTIETIMSEGRQ